MPLSDILEKLLVSESPVSESAVTYTFCFDGDNSVQCYIEVSRNYSRSEFGEWEIEQVDFF